jgi:hypothetical protein
MCWVGTFLARICATQNGDRLLLLSRLRRQNLQRPAAAAHFALVIDGNGVARCKVQRLSQITPLIDAPGGGR